MQFVPVLSDDDGLTYTMVILGISDMMSGLHPSQVAGALEVMLEELQMRSDNSTTPALSIAPEELQLRSDDSAAPILSIASWNALM